MNTRDYPILHIRHKIKEQFVVRMAMDVNEHERLSNITLKTQNQVNEQLFFSYIISRTNYFSM
jgi:hypothetical protein